MSLREVVKKLGNRPRRDKLERAKKSESELSRVKEVKIELENSMLHAEVETKRSRESTG